MAKSSPSKPDGTPKRRPGPKGRKPKLTHSDKLAVMARVLNGDHTARTGSYVRMPTDLHEAAKICADRLSMSLNAFIVQAVSYRVRNWRDPVTGARVIEHIQKRLPTLKWEGWTCTHGSHGPLDAADCPQRESRHHQQQMIHEELGLYQGWQDLTSEDPYSAPQQAPSKGLERAGPVEQAIHEAHDTPSEED